MNKKKLVLPTAIIITIGIFVSILINLIPSDVAAAKNQIMPMILTEEQRDIVDLIRKDAQQILFFAYETDEKYNHLEVWGEIYQDGKLVETSEEKLNMDINTRSDIEESYKGNIMIAMDKFSDPQWEWEVNINENGNKMHMRESFYAYPMSPGVGVSSSIVSPVNIENDEEIILHTIVFKRDGGISNLGNSQQFIEHPELLNNYNYAFLIKCKFIESSLIY